MAGNKKVVLRLFVLFNHSTVYNMFKNNRDAKTILLYWKSTVNVSVKLFRCTPLFTVSNVKVRKGVPASPYF